MNKQNAASLFRDKSEKKSKKTFNKGCQNTKQLKKIPGFSQLESTKTIILAQIYWIYKMYK